MMEEIELIFYVHITYERMKKIQDEFPHNLKYFKTDFIPKFSSLENEKSIREMMIEHIKELIELNYRCELDGINNILIYDEEEFDKIITEKLKNNIKLFIISDIFMSSEQQFLINQKNIEIIEVPEYYYREELREVGEL